MLFGSDILPWETLSEHLDNMLNEIFMNYNIDELSDIEKRKLIFDYLAENIEYDYDLLNIMKQYREKAEIKGELSDMIDSNGKLYNVIINKKGVCTAISQTYDLLLEKVGIFSICCRCNDGTNVRHEILLVKNNSSYSFDDPTSVIVNRGTKEQFFNYDLDDAKNNNQTDFQAISPRCLFLLANRNDKPNGYYSKEWFIEMPSNIIKQQYSQKSK